MRLMQIPRKYILQFCNYSLPEFHGEMFHFV